MKKIVTLIISLIMSIGTTLIPVHAEEINTQTIEVQNQAYQVKIIEGIKQRTSIVTDENGKDEVVVFNKENNTITIEGKTYFVGTEEVSAPKVMRAKSKNKVLSRKSVKIPGPVINLGAAAIIAAISAATGSPAVALGFLQNMLQTFLTGWADPLIVTITKYRSGSLMKSGKYKGKYKYWTTVTLKQGKRSFSEDHTIYYK